MGLKESKLIGKPVEVLARLHLNRLGAADENMFFAVKKAF